MKIKKPNIHIFVEHKKYYLYDVNINAVVTIPYELYEFFSLWGKEDEKEITADIEEDISFLMEQGFLTEKKKISSIKHYETDTLKDLYMYNMGNVILQVTQNCNLRCEYCVYSGSYINRVHTNKRMSFETAVKTIDFLAAHSLNCNEVQQIIKILEEMQDILSLVHSRCVETCQHRQSYRHNTVSFEPVFCLRTDTQDHLVDVF